MMWRESVDTVLLAAVIAAALIHGAGINPGAAWGAMIFAMVCWLLASEMRGG
jgi:hypothetical protein